MPGTKQTTTIARELSRSLALTVVVVVVIVGGALVLSSRYAAEQRLREQAQGWTAQLARFSEVHLWNVDEVGLQNACLASLQPPEVTGARIFDPERAGSWPTPRSPRRSRS